MCIKAGFKHIGYLIIVLIHLAKANSDRYNGREPLRDRNQDLQARSLQIYSLQIYSLQIHSLRVTFRVTIYRLTICRYTVCRYTGRWNSDMERSMKM